MNDVGFPVARVLDGIDAAAAAGLAGQGQHGRQARRQRPRISPMAEHFRDSGHILRFIEYMDVGTTNGWRLDDVVPAAEIVARSTRDGRSSRSCRLPRRGRQPLALPRRRRRNRHDRLGHPTLLRRLHTRAAIGRRQALHLPVRHHGHDLRAMLRGGATDEELAERAALDLEGPHGPLLRSPPAHTEPTRRSRCPTSAADADVGQIAAAALFGALRSIDATPLRCDDRPLTLGHGLARPAAALSPGGCGDSRCARGNEGRL